MILHVVALSKAFYEGICLDARVGSRIAASARTGDLITAWNMQRGRLHGHDGLDLRTESLRPTNTPMPLSGGYPYQTSTEAIIADYDSVSSISFATSSSFSIRSLTKLSQRVHRKQAHIIPAVTCMRQRHAVPRLGLT